MRKIIIGFCAILLMTVTSINANAKEYKIAVTDIQGMDALISEWGPFIDALSEVTGDSFEFFDVANHTATAEAMRATIAAETWIVFMFLMNYNINPPEMIKGQKQFRYSKSN